MSEENEAKNSKSFLEQLKNKKLAPVQVPLDSAQPESENIPTEAKADTATPMKETKGKAVKKKKSVAVHSTLNNFSSFSELKDVLLSEKESFNFQKRIVYVDEDVADVLDLLKRKERINSNLLVSYLIQQFFLTNMDLIQELKDRKENKFLD